MANTYLRPGVYINESLTGVSTASGAVSADSVAAFVGAGTRGPVTPTEVTDWTSFQALFGGVNDSPYLGQALFDFFANRGGRAYVARVVGSGAVAATRVLNDTATSPLPTLEVDAVNVGTWGNSVYLDVNTNATTGRFDLVVKYGSAAAGSVVETYTDLSISSTDKRYAPAVVNSLSKYIVLTDKSSTTAAPNNAPASQTGVALASGSDGAVPAAADYQSAVNNLGSINQPLVLNLPGVTDTATLTDVISWAETSQKTFVVVDPPQGQTVAQVETYASGLTASSYAAVYYPWVKVVDPTKSNVVKTVPPGGLVVGQVLATDAAEGPYKTPAGVKNRITGAVGLEVALLPADYDTLNSAAAPVNAIKPVPGFGVCIFGGRTLKAGYSDKYISIRRSLIYIEQALKNATQFAVFEPNDNKLWKSVTDKATAILRDFYSRGGLSGGSEQQAFYVTCGPTNNTPATIQQGLVNLEVGVALEYPAEFIVIRIGQFEGGSSITTTTN